MQDHIQQIAAAKAADIRATLAQAEAELKQKCDAGEPTNLAYAYGFGTLHAALELAAARLDSIARLANGGAR